MKKVIGVTGGVGSGKSRVLNFLENDYEAEVIMADKVAAGLEKKGHAAYLKLVGAFGEGILGDDREIDREAFSSLIFSDPEALLKVDSIVHPLTIEEIAGQIAKSTASLAVIEAAVFPEGLRALCDEIWFVDTDEPTRKQRLMRDRGYSAEKCDDIMKSQASREEFMAMCDHVIDNSGSLEDTKEQIIVLLGPPEDYRKRDQQ